MQSFTAINHKESAPEYQYCCGTTCDREKLANQFIKKDSMIVAQRNLIKEMESYIKQLEGRLNDKLRQEGSSDTFKGSYGATGKVT